MKRRHFQFFLKALIALIYTNIVCVEDCWTRISPEVTGKSRMNCTKSIFGRQNSSNSGTCLNPSGPDSGVHPDPTHIRYRGCFSRIFQRPKSWPWKCTCTANCLCFVLIQHKAIVFDLHRIWWRDRTTAV